MNLMMAFKSKFILGQWIFFSLATLSTGLFLLCNGWLDYSRNTATLDHGAKATAHIISARTNSGARFGRENYVIGLSWRDRAGQERTMEATVVSDNFWKQIVSGKNIIVHDTPIKYLESDTVARAILVLDANYEIRDNLIGVYGGIILITIGALAFAYCVRLAKRVRRNSQDLKHA